MNYYEWRRPRPEDNEGLASDPASCECAYWTRRLDPPGLGPTHADTCPMRPEKLLRDAMETLRAAVATTGPKHEAWTMFERLHLATTGTLPAKG